MSHPIYELHRLDPNTFEHLVNSLALKVLGAGQTGFGPGRDGGRDGYFQGEAPYPSSTTRWSGRWYIQSKFMGASTSKDPQKWLLQNIDRELSDFANPAMQRRWPDNWIIATNIEPSGAPRTGSFDKANELVAQIRPQLAERFDIWGGRKILDLLAQFPEVAAYYSQFLTSGQVLAKLYQQLSDTNADIDSIIRYLVVTQLADQQYTRLEQAGSASDTRPGIERLYTDLPFSTPDGETVMLAMAEMSKASAQNFAPNDLGFDNPAWRDWLLKPARSRIWFVKGGPGQGKSTLTQYFAQIQRAAFVLDNTPLKVLHHHRGIAERVREAASKNGFWPNAARIPFVIELKEFAQWYAKEDASRRVLRYLAYRLSLQLEQDVVVGTLKRAFSNSRWLFVFDGLDEVPGDVKDAVAEEIVHFSNDFLVGCNSDAFIICTSRPQGYSGQFNHLGATTVGLEPLSTTQAIECATPVLYIDRSQGEAQTYKALLEEAIQSPAVADIMTTPLQAHIMAVVVRDGGKPPERKWLLFSNYYQTIKRREANKNSPDKRIAALLREEDKLLKALHNRLGFELHARAEKGATAVTSLSKDEFHKLANQVVMELKDTDVEKIVDLVMEATTERLVLVNTPDNGSAVRFDVRQLQEFFAAEFIYDTIDPKVFAERVRIISGDSHWREVLHFLLSGLIENDRRLDLQSAAAALRQLDNGRDDNENRMLARRLALGSIASSRLLTEGVLEQDKRLRGVFREGLNPLLACTDAASLLPTFGPAHTAAWLTTAVVDSLIEQAETENIGAAIIAACLLADDHDSIVKVTSAFLKTSPRYRRALLALAEGQFVGAHLRKPPRWFLRVVLQFLMDSNWRALEVDGVDAAIQLIRAGKKTAECAALDIGFSAPLASLLPDCFGRSHFEAVSDDTHQKIQISGIVVAHVPPKSAFTYDKLGIDLINELEKIDGLFRAISSGLKFIKFQNDESAKKFLDEMGGDVRLFATMPQCVSSYLDAKISDKTTFLDWISKDDERRAHHLEFSFVGEKVDWQEFLRKYLYVVLHLMSQSHNKAMVDSLRAFLATEVGAENFLAAIKCDVGTLISHPEVWDQCFQLQFVGPQIREEAARAARSYHPPSSYYYGDVDAEAPKLALPAESVLLPHIAWLLAERAWTRRLDYHQQTKKASITQRFSEGISRWAPHLEQLVDVANDSSLPKRESASAFIMAIARHDYPAEMWEANVASLPSRLEGCSAIWFLRIVAAALNDKIALGDGRAQAVISKLLELSRNDYEARTSFDSILQYWRELTSTPVESSDPEIWKLGL